jgi:hypothetical protein
MLNVDQYLTSPPSWGRDGTQERYVDALAALGLALGSNPSARCPEGGHEDSDDQNVVAYDRGLMCYSRHGFIALSRVIELAGLPAAAGGLSLTDLTEREVGRFVARDQLQSLLTAAIAERLGWSGPRQKAAVECLIGWATRAKRSDLHWNQRLQAVCHGRYPAHAREFWCVDRIVHRQHLVASQLDDLGRSGGPSYRVQIVWPREKPSPPLAIALAPALANVVQDKCGNLKASCSASTDRFLAGQREAVAQSSLVAIECIDRPVPSLSGGWHLPSDAKQLPLYISVAAPSVTVVDGRGLIQELFADMQATFAYVDHEAFVRSVACLIQPMLNVLMPGQFPGYFYSGPTKSGKTYLAGPFPAEVYRHNAGQSVYLTRIPSSDYEMAVQLAAHRAVLYAVFDEVIDMTEEQLKILDQMITAPNLVSRVMRVGYLTRPNHVTFAFTAVAKSLPPESAGRILEIHLSESRPVEIEKFYVRWRRRGPQILRALFDALRCIKDLHIGDPVPERRPGFGILKRVLREAFGLVAVFDIGADEDDILDLICNACFQQVGSERPGGWRRISFSTLATHYNTQTGLKANKRTMERRVYTALGYESTRRHPAYQQTGYRWEDNRHYDIEIRHEGEGGGQTRSSVYVRERKGAAAPATADETERRKADVAIRPKTPSAPPSAEPIVDVGSNTVEYDLTALENEVLGSESTDA